ncbi:hypothetical protein AK812_SmicGene1593 [Symbiodinium microadriaticum]|uniref:Amine oxidase domain-containing protein n=1 Tax=Symbiodinium microadriaticum TaxID=2951 RepID=A0A1Q9F3M4_SYMMI|nr:hypothetical protein AK812_SmicGene1593 [Symbiodinium microadriaticum]
MDPTMLLSLLRQLTLKLAPEGSKEPEKGPFEVPKERFLGIGNYLGLAVYFVVLVVSMVAAYRFYILRFSITYPWTSWYDEGLNLFDVAYADVIWGGTSSIWGLSQRLLTWAIVATVWTIEPHLRSLSWWLWLLHACLIVPKFGHCGPRMDRGALYFVLAMLSFVTHITSTGGAMPQSDCQISISVDVLASSVLTCVFAAQHVSVPELLLCPGFRWTVLAFVASPGFVLGCVCGFYQHGFRGLPIVSIVVPLLVNPFFRYWRSTTDYPMACRQLVEVVGGEAAIKDPTYSEIEKVGTKYGPRRVVGLDKEAASANDVETKAIDSIYHFDKAKFFREAAKVLKINESLIFTDVVLRPNSPAWVRVCLCAMDIPMSGHWPLSCTCRLGGFEESAVSEAGFRVTSWKSLVKAELYQVLAKPSAAVIGSGLRKEGLLEQSMSGLIAAHLLQETHDVTIYESGPKCGLVGLQEELAPGVAVDVPLSAHIWQHLKFVPYLAKLMFTVFLRKEIEGESFLEYMTRHGLHEHEAYRIYSNIMRVYPTMRALQDALLRGKDLRLGCPVKPFGGSRVIDGRAFDVVPGRLLGGVVEVLVATDAAAAGYLLGGEWKERLSKIHYHKGRIVVHKDPALMPPSRTDWRTFNIREDGAESTCQITVWLNKFWGRDDLQEDLFETWNPAAQPAENFTIKEVTLGRATYTKAMKELWSWIRGEQGRDGFYLAGAYAVEGMSLLEQACYSAMMAVDAIQTPGFDKWKDSRKQDELITGDAIRLHHLTVELLVR